MAALKYLAEHPRASANTIPDGNANADANADADANPKPHHLLDIPGARRILISLTGKSWERALLWRLDWTNFL